MCFTRSFVLFRSLLSFTFDFFFYCYCFVLQQQQRWRHHHHLKVNIFTVKRFEDHETRKKNRNGKRTKQNENEKHTEWKKKCKQNQTTGAMLLLHVGCYRCCFFFMFSFSFTHSSGLWCVWMLFFVSVLFIFSWSCMFSVPTFSVRQTNEFLGIFRFV